jgi:hypothetical protein
MDGILLTSVGGTLICALACSAETRSASDNKAAQPAIRPLLLPMLLLLTQ